MSRPKEKSGFSLETKLWLAPVLAVVLALFIAGAVSQFTPQNPTDASSTIPTPSEGMPASMADLYSLPLFFMFSVGAVVVGVAATFLFFREKNLNKQ